MMYTIIQWYWFKLLSILKHIHPLETLHETGAMPLNFCAPCEHSEAIHPGGACRGACWEAIHAVQSKLSYHVGDIQIDIVQFYRYDRGNIGDIWYRLIFSATIYKIL